MINLSLLVVNRISLNCIGKGLKSLRLSPTPPHPVADDLSCLLMNVQQFLNESIEIVLKLPSFSLVQYLEQKLRPFLCNSSVRN